MLVYPSRMDRGKTGSPVRPAWRLELAQMRDKSAGSADLVVARGPCFEIRWRDTAAFGDPPGRVDINAHKSTSFYHLSEV